VSGIEVGKAAVGVLFTEKEKRANVAGWREAKDRAGNGLWTFVMLCLLLPPLEILSDFPVLPWIWYAICLFLHGFSLAYGVL